MLNLNGNKVNLRQTFNPLRTSVCLTDDSSIKIWGLRRLFTFYWKKRPLEFLRWRQIVLFVSVETAERRSLLVLQVVHANYAILHPNMSQVWLISSRHTVQRFQFIPTLVFRRHSFFRAADCKEKRLWHQSRILNSRRGLTARTFLTEYNYKQMNA